MSDLKRQSQFHDSFETWFNSTLKPTIDDNRRRYRMEHKDREKNEDLGLSAIPSTKSTSAIDRAVERAIMEYHGERDAISFTAKNSGSKELDFLAAIHTENFHIRAEDSFPFPVWNATSMTAGFIDGLEAALVSWKLETYTDTKTVEKYYALNQLGVAQEVSEEIYQQYSQMAPDFFYTEEVEEEEEVKTIDTWWIDQLIPGENLYWDMKAPLLDLNLGQCCLVKVERTVDDILQMAEKGIIDKITKEELKKFQDTDTPEADSSDTTDPDLDEFNMVELRIWFTRDAGQWGVQFFLEDKKDLSKRKSLNDAWYNGRRVNQLPVVMGTTRLKPFMPTGRGIPETIAPVEDEYEKIRNLTIDAARQDIEGRWRLDRNSDIDLNQLVNSPVVYADSGSFEKFDDRSNNLGALQQISQLVGDINELAPVGMESSAVAPHNSDTLGEIQLALGSSNEKIGVSLMVRNFTFFKKIVHLISELTIAFETDENLLKIAETRLGKKRQHQGQALPRKGGMIDLEALDVPLNVSINAGLGAVPRQQKLQYGQFLVQIAQSLGIPLDGLEIFMQASTLLGFSEDQFVSQEPQQPPGPELTGTLNIDFDRLLAVDPQKAMAILEVFAQQSEKLKTNFKGTGKIDQPPQQVAPALDPTGGMNGQI